MASSGISPTASGDPTSTPRFVYGLVYGLLVSMLIWAMIAYVVYELA